MKLVIIANAHTPYSGQLMERSAKRVGIEVVRYREGEAWPGDYRVGKLVHGAECVRALPADVTHVMFLDNSDTLVLACAEEIVQKFEAIQVPVLICGEKNCYPIAEMVKEYPPALTPWRFVNSGGWIARREHAAPAMECAASRATFCDQLCWTKTYLEGHTAVIIDQNCQIFQSMFLQKRGELEFKNGRLLNTVTNGRPCVAHWNGTRNAAPDGLLSRAGMWACMAIEDLGQSSILPKGVAA